jgi:hypothetical protein
MSYTLHIDEQLQADGELIKHLKSKKYKFVLRFFNASYGFNFRNDQSGAVFESCIDFCAQNAGTLDEAKQALLGLFETFYEDLPPSVRENLAYLGDEIGYRPKQTNLQKCQQAYRKQVSSATTALTSTLVRMRALFAQLRNRLKTDIRRPRVYQSSERFKVTIPASMMMQQGDDDMLNIRK